MPIKQSIKDGLSELVANAKEQYHGFREDARAIKQDFKNGNVSWKELGTAAGLGIAYLLASGTGIAAADFGHNLKYNDNGYKVTNLGDYIRAEKGNTRILDFDKDGIGDLVLQDKEDGYEGFTATTRIEDKTVTIDYNNQLVGETATYDDHNQKRTYDLLSGEVKIDGKTYEVGHQLYIDQIKSEIESAKKNWETPEISTTEAEKMIKELEEQKQKVIDEIGIDKYNMLSSEYIEAKSSAGYIMQVKLEDLSKVQEMDGKNLDTLKNVQDILF